MIRALMVVSVVCLGCASPRVRPSDMSAAEHEAAAVVATEKAQATVPEEDASNAMALRCRAQVSGETGQVPPSNDLCWSSVVSPTQNHRTRAEQHRRLAAQHRAAAATLHEAEERACAGIPLDDKDVSPFEHSEDIAGVQPLTERTGSAKMPTNRTTGAIVTFRAVPGLTAEWLQRLIDCHLARNASLGHDVPEMPTCPLVPKGAQAKVASTGNGFAVTVRAEDPKNAAEILSRAQQLVVTPAP